MCCVELTLIVASIMSPNEGEIAVHGYYCALDIAMLMCKILARWWVGVCVPLALLYWHKENGNS